MSYISEENFLSNCVGSLCPSRILEFEIILSNEASRLANPLKHFVSDKR